MPDFKEPVILSSKHCKVEDFCLKIHKTLLDQFKNALVWGSSTKHNPMTCGKDHVLEDGDVVEIVKNPSGLSTIKASEIVEKKPAKKKEGLKT